VSAHYGSEYGDVPVIPMSHYKCIEEGLGKLAGQATFSSGYRLGYVGTDWVRPAINISANFLAEKFVSEQFQDETPLVKNLRNQILSGEYCNRRKFSLAKIPAAKTLTTKIPCAIQQYLVIRSEMNHGIQTVQVILSNF